MRGWLLCLERSQLRWFGHLRDATLVSPYRDVLAPTSWEEASGHTENWISRKDLCTGMGLPWNPLIRAGARETESLGSPAGTTP